MEFIIIGKIKMRDRELDKLNVTTKDGRTVNSAQSLMRLFLYKILL